MSRDCRGRLYALSLDPAFACFRDVLGAADNDRLLQEALACEPAFMLAPVTDDCRIAVDRKVRASRILVDLGETARSALRLIVDHALRAPPLFAAPSPDRFGVDARLLHYGDGDFFAIHRDATPPPRPGARLVSFVYLFFREPAMFDGGVLRLYGERPGSDPFVDIEPRNDILIVFAPSTPHEVLPVQLSGDRFADGRFAINGWLVAP